MTPARLCCLAALLLCAVLKIAVVATSCAAGRFGQNCAFSCHCAADSSCNDDGSCNLQKCDDKWQGHKCQIHKNVAEGKSVHLSSRMPYWKLNSNLAVDGNADRIFGQTGSCIGTAMQSNPWLRIDLKQEHVVQSVTIVTVGKNLYYVWDNSQPAPTSERHVTLFPDRKKGISVSLPVCLERCSNRTHCSAVVKCKSAWSEHGCWRLGRYTRIYSGDCLVSEQLDTQLKSLQVRIGNNVNTINDNHMCTSSPVTVPGDSIRTISCDQAAVGRYLFLQLTSSDVSSVLSLCEVSVTAYKSIECRRGFGGVTCDADCPQLCGAGTGGCHKVTLQCCENFKTGALCEKEMPSLRKVPRSNYVNSSSIWITWDSWHSGHTGDGVGPVNKYRVQMRADDSAWGAGDDVERVNDRNLNLLVKRYSSLTHNTWYSFRVACYLTDSLGEVLGKYTQAAKLKTDCIAPLQIELSNDRIISSSSGDWATLQVSWNVFTKANSGCDHMEYFIVMYKKKGEISYAGKRTSGNLNSFTIDNLDVYTEYHILIEAYNNEDIKSTSNTVSHMTAEGRSDMVNNPVSSASPNNLTLTWEPPTNPRGVITEYIIQYRQMAIVDCDHNALAWTQKVAVKAGTRHTITGLMPYRYYEVKIVPVNGAGEGSGKTVTVTTEKTVPTGTPVDVQVIKINARSVVLKWEEVPCRKRNGVIKSYRYLITGLKYSNISKYIDTGSTKLTSVVASLIPFANYSVKVAAVNDKGASPNYSSGVKFGTLDDVPPAPQNLAIPSTKPTSLTVTWSPPYPPHGKIQMYQIQHALKYEESNGVQNSTVEANVTSLKLDHLITNATYIIRARAKTRIGWGNWSGEVFAFTAEGVPTQPLKFTLTKRNEDMLTFSWEEPSFPNGKVIAYKVTCNASNQEVPGSSRVARVTGLTPGSLYKCRVSGKTSAGHGDLSDVISAWTLPQPPQPPVTQSPEEDIKTTDTTITFKTPIFHSSKISNFEVHVDKIDSLRRRRASLDINAPNFTSCSKDEDERDTYITAQLSPEGAGGTFTVGDNKEYGGYWNCPLVKDNTYSIFYAAVVNSLNGEKARSFVPVGVFKTSVKEETNYEVVIIACVCSVVVIAVIVGVAIFMARRKRKGKPEKSSWSGSLWSRISKSKAPSNVSTSLTDGIPLSPVLNPVDAEADDVKERVDVKGDTEESEPLYANSLADSRYNAELLLDQLLPYIHKQRQGQDKGFTEEYKSLPVGLQTSILCTMGSRKENKAKNRFKNIMTYDHSRVILDELPDEVSSDYINASYIDGYKTPKKFIASQGATPVMISDFWRMIWQYSINRIVMVTNLVESRQRKCEQYWPDGDEANIYAGIKVKLEGCEILADFTVRTFILSKDGKMKTVRQFHYTAWPDHGVPDHATSLLSFRRKVKSYDNISKGPIVVHCSAGVGRTGTFIALDVLLEQAQSEEKVGVYSFVEYMRKQRPNMVQTQAQYIFLYKAIFEGVRTDDTIVTPVQFLDTYNSFIQKNQSTGLSKMDEQFSLLLSLRQPINPDAQSAGRLPENVDKNRSMDILPVNTQRPYLSTPVPETTDYINAFYINGYQQKDAFIVTQMPLPHTRVDLLRLLMDHRSNCVVMLNPIDPHDETCLPYWPEQENAVSVYGPFTVSNVAIEQKSESLVVQKLSLTYKTKDTEIKREIKHFQIRDWPLNQELPSVDSLLALLEMVTRWQQQSGHSTVTVHCLDGASRCGIYLAVHYILEKLKLEQELDIFNAISYIQINRPQLIGSKDQYKFCHDVVVRYLKSCETYSNFT